MLSSGLLSPCMNGDTGIMPGFPAWSWRAADFLFMDFLLLVHVCIGLLKLKSKWEALLLYTNTAASLTVD